MDLHLPIIVLHGNPSAAGWRENAENAIISGSGTGNEGPRAFIENGFSQF